MLISTRQPCLIGNRDSEIEKYLNFFYLCTFSLCISSILREGELCFVSDSRVLICEWENACYKPFYLYIPAYKVTQPIHVNGFFQLIYQNSKQNGFSRISNITMYPLICLSFTFTHSVFFIFLKNQALPKTTRKTHLCLTLL